MRLIDADALPRHGQRKGIVYSRDIDNAPTIDSVPSTIEGALGYLHKVGWMQEHDRIMTEDAVPVVRCKDCKWYVRSMIKQDGTLDERYKPDWCDLYRREREETYFCADGERKDNEID